MDIIEITPDLPPPASLTIPLDVEFVLPRAHLPTAALLLRKFPDTFTAPCSGAGVPVWSDSPPHDVRAALLRPPVQRMSWNRFIHDSQPPLGLDGMEPPKIIFI